MISHRLREIRDKAFNRSTAEMAKYLGEIEGTMKMIIYGARKQISADTLDKLYEYGINLNYLSNSDELVYNLNKEEGRLLYYLHGEGKYIDILKVAKRNYFVLDKYQTLDNFCQSFKINVEQLRKYLTMHIQSTPEIDHAFRVAGEDEDYQSHEANVANSYEQAETIDDVIRLLITETIAKVQEQAVNEVVSKDKIISAFARVLLKGLK